MKKEILLFLKWKKYVASFVFITLGFAFTAFSQTWFILTGAVVDSVVATPLSNVIQCICVGRRF